MNRREFLETIVNAVKYSWHLEEELNGKDYEFIVKLNLEEYRETGHSVLGLGSDLIGINNLKIKDLLKSISWGYATTQMYISVVLFFKIQDASFGCLPQDVDDIGYWKYYIEHFEEKTKRKVDELLLLLADKGLVEIFLDDSLAYKYNLLEYIDSSKIVNGIRNGSRFSKLSGVTPSKLLYDDNVLSALVDTGQIDAIVEDNSYSDKDDYIVKKEKVNKKLKLHKVVPDIIENLENTNYDYKDFDVSRMKNFVSDEDFELINNAYLKYQEDIKNIRVVPQEEEKKEEINSKDVIINMLRDGIVTEDDLLEIIVDYRKEEKNVKKLKKVKNC